MSVCRPARCLFSKATSSSLPRPSPPNRSFHASAPRAARKRRPHYPSIKADDLQLLNEAADKEFPKYDVSETNLLSKRYTPAQIAAIKAAEKNIDARDVVTQGQQRTDPWRLSYKDDLSVVQPVIDHAEKLSHEDLKGDTKIRQANPVEQSEGMQWAINENLAKMYPDGVPEGELDPHRKRELKHRMAAAFTQAALDPRTFFTSENMHVRDALVDPRHSIIQPDLPRIENRMVRQTLRSASKERQDPREKRLLQYMNWGRRQLSNIRVKTLVNHSVSNQTRMGKIRKVYFLTIAGNSNGLLGVGEGKSVEAGEGRKQSVMAAIRNLKPVPRYENRTTFGTLEKKVGATKVQLFSRPPGFGLRVQHLIFELARLAGIQDLSAKIPRSRNKMNVIKATWEALCNQKLPDEIARGRGKKLVDVRKVYYGKSVY